MFDDLIQQGLVKEKIYPNGLRIFKYTKKVFWDNLWKTDDLLLEARGIVLDEHDNKVIWPFTKVFNYGENGTTCDGNQSVQVIDKINGFLAAARYYKGEVIVSTTGTLDSEYAVMGRTVLDNTHSLSWPLWHALANHTLIFEICHPDDPHIVEERYGAYLIGMRNMSTGKMESEDFLDYVASRGNFLRPAHRWCNFDDVLEDVKSCQHEGYMIRNSAGEHLMKIKSPHYLTKKALMRIGDNKVDLMYDSPDEYKKSMDEEFQSVVDYILADVSREYWKALNDQERRKVIEQFFQKEGVFSEHRFSGVLA